MRLLVVFVVAVFSVSAFAQANPGQGGSLPPGLQKKVERGESLPPGWAKRLEAGDHLPRDYHRHGVIHRDDHRHDRVRIDDRVFKVIRDTGLIVDILEGY